MLHAALSTRMDRLFLYLGLTFHDEAKLCCNKRLNNTKYYGDERMPTCSIPFNLVQQHVIEKGKLERIVISNYRIYTRLILHLDYSILH